MSDGEGGREEGCGWGEVSKFKNTPVSSSAAAVERFFSEPRIFLLMTIAGDSPLPGQSASGLNFYDDSGRSPLAD